MSENSRNGPWLLHTEWFDDGQDPEWLMLSGAREVSSAACIYTVKFIWFKASRF